MKGQFVRLLTDEERRQWNLLTEDGAGMRYCPMGRHQEVDDHCLGSNCMAWQWVGTVEGSAGQQGYMLGRCGMAPLGAI